MVPLDSDCAAVVAKMTKIKAVPEESEAQAEGCNEERTYEELLVNLNPIAQPLASRRLTRKLYKCIKKGEVGRPAGSRREDGWTGSRLTLLFAAVKQKQIRRGVKEVQKFVNKGEKG